jgi:hypothetical protein
MVEKQHRTGRKLEDAVSELRDHPRNEETAEAARAE